MKLLLKSMFIVFLAGSVWAQDPDQVFLITASQDADAIDGDALYRSVYFIRVPNTFTDSLFIRVFDADTAGLHDRWIPGTQARYRVFGKGGISHKAIALSDALSDQAPLADLTLGENREYDNRWRTLAVVEPKQGDAIEDTVWFQLVVDGIKGSGTNKYQVFISAMEKENRPVSDLQLWTPIIGLNLPQDTVKATEVRFDIPTETGSLTFFNFDADQADKAPQIVFQTRFGKTVRLPSSGNGRETSFKVTLDPEDREQTGAIVITNEKAPNNMKVWVQDDQDRKIPLKLPVYTARKNSLPVPRIAVTPLSECFSVMLDGALSRDDDDDELTYQWIFGDGTVRQGGRIVHDFKKAGRHDLTLIVTDSSGFLANAGRLNQQVQINDPPVVMISAPTTVEPGMPVVFDGSGSRDTDGRIIDYRWDFGDGEKATGVTVEHRFAAAGRYSVRLVVEDDGKTLCSTSRTSHQVWVNAPPVARIDVKPVAAIDEPVTVDASKSVDSDGQIVHYQWDFGDGSSGSGQKTEHSWKHPGKYTIQLTITDDATVGNSEKTEKQTIVINAPPVPDIKAGRVIAADTPMTFDATGSNDPDGRIVQFFWDMGDENKKQGPVIDHAYQLPGEYQGKLTVVDDSGTLNRQSVMDFTVRVNHPPVPDAGEDQVVNESLVFFDAGKTTDRDDPIISYLWNFGDGQKAEGITTSHVYSLPGAYRVRLTVTDASGTKSAVQSDEINVVINFPPVADAGLDRRAAPGEKLTFDGSFSEDRDGSIEIYQWDLGPGTILDGQTVEHQFAEPGSYQVRLTVTDNHGAMGMDYAVITVNAPPTADFFPVKRSAPGEKILFDGSPSQDTDGRIVKAVWHFSDVSESETGLSVNRKFSRPGRYTATLTVYDDSNASNHSASLTRPVEINFSPIADAGQDIHTCRQTVRFDGSGSYDADGDILGFHWDFGDGSVGKSRRPEHVYADPGIYPVTLTVDDGMGLPNSISRSQITAHVNAPPSARISVNRKSVCAGELVLFDAGKSSDPEQGILHYLWDLGNNKTAEGVNPVNAYLKGGDYRIHLKVMDDSNLACNFSEDETVIHVIDAPIADAGQDQTVCANQMVTFDGSGSTGGGRIIKSYEWEFGDGNFGVGAHPTHVYSDPGIYTVRLVITVSGKGECENSSEDQMIVNIIAAPAAEFTGPQQGCAGEVISFDAEKSTSMGDKITAYQWNFGDGTTGSGKNIEHAYTMPGDYQVTLDIATDSTRQCNSAQVSRPIRINAKPSGAIEVHSEGRDPFREKNYQTATYSLLGFTGKNSTDTDGHINEYLWDFGDGQQKKGYYVQHQYDQPGQYTVKLIVSDDSPTSCSKAEAEMNVHVRDIRQQVISGPDSGCVDVPMTFSVASDNSSIKWDFGDGSEAEGRQIVKTFVQPGNYQIQAVIGDQATAAKTVLIRKLSEIEIPETIEAFVGDPVEIQPIHTDYQGMNTVFSWQIDNGAVLNSQKFQHMFKEQGQHRVTLLVSSSEGPDCLNAAFPIQIRVLPPPQVKIRVEPETIYSGGGRDAAMFEAVLKTSDGRWKYEWDFGDGTRSPGSRVYHTFKKEGTYNVQVALTDASNITDQVYQFSRKINVKKR